MPKSKPNWPLGLSLGDLGADRVAKRAKRTADAKNPASSRPGSPAIRTDSAEGDPEAPSAKRIAVTPRWLPARPAIAPEA